MNTKNTNQELRHRNPYQVPEGYFSDLNNSIRARIAEQKGVDEVYTVGGIRGWFQKAKGMAGFALTFSCLVMFAMVGYYFTGYQAQQREFENDPLLGYTVHSEDIELLLGNDLDEEEGQAVFAQAVTEYLDTFGYGFVDNETLSGTENAEEN